MLTRYDTEIMSWGATFVVAIIVLICLFTAETCRAEEETKWQYLLLCNDRSLMAMYVGGDPTNIPQSRWYRFKTKDDLALQIKTAGLCGGTIYRLDQYQQMTVGDIEIPELVVEPQRACSCSPQSAGHGPWLYDYGGTLNLDCSNCSHD